MAPTSPSADRRREHRRSAIAAACLDRFAHEGFAEARLELLAQDAALSRQNLLFYFRDKADLWAESITCATEEVFRVLTRLVTGEAGPTAVRAMRRGLDEVSRVLPSAFTVLLDSAGGAPRASGQQQQRTTAAQAAFFAAHSAALSSPAAPTESTHRLTRLAWLTLLAHHREARTHDRSGLAAGIPLAADLDFAEVQLVAIASAHLPRGR